MSRRWSGESGSSNISTAWTAGPAVFANMNREEVREWKRVQAETANKKIKTLETRLKRLHALDEKLQHARTKGSDPSLPGEVPSDEGAIREYLRDELFAIVNDEDANMIKPFANDSTEPTAKPDQSSVGLPGQIRMAPAARDAGWKEQGESTSVEALASPVKPTHFRSSAEGDEQGEQSRTKQNNPAESGVEHKDSPHSQDCEAKTSRIPFSWLCVFSEVSVIRQFCAFVYASPSWNAFFFAVNLANCIYIVIAPSLFGNVSAIAETSWNSDRAEFWAAAFDLFCVAVLAFEIVVGSIAHSPSRKSWLLCPPHRKLEFGILLICALEYLATALGVRMMTLRSLRLLRAIRLLSTLQTFKRARVFAMTIREGSLQLSMVFSILVFFTCTFGILGMAILQKSFRRACVIAERSIPGCASDFSTAWNATCDFRNLTELHLESGTAIAISGGHPFEKACKIVANSTAGEFDGEHSLDALGRYHTCPPTEMCEDLDNPGQSFSHFDHMGGAIITMFQAGIPDSYYDIIHRSLEAEPRAEPLLWLIWFSVTCVITFLILGIFIAVVTGTYDRVSRQQAESEVRQPTELYKQYASFRASRMASKRTLIQDAASSATEAEHTPTLLGEASKVVGSLVVLAHFFMMASDQHDASEAWGEVVFWAYVGCSGYFGLELLVRLLCEQRRRAFLARPGVVFEAAMCVSSAVGLVTGEKLLYFLPALRLYRLMKFLPTLEHLLLSAVASTHALVDLVLFVACVCFCFTVTGRYFFGNAMDGLTRSNFGSLYRAFLTMFQLFTGDSWSGVLYTAMASQDTIVEQALAACFVLSWLFLSLFIIENLFISVIIQNFQIAEVLDDIKKPGVGSSIRSFVARAWAGFPRSTEQARERQSVADAVVANAAVRKAAKTLKAGVQSPHSLVKRGSITQVVKSQASRSDLSSHAGPASSKEHASVEDDDDEIVLILFHKSNWIRRALTWLGEQAFFEIVVYLTIVASFVVLVLTPPYDDVPGQDQPISHKASDQWASVFTYIFTAEFVVRAMSRGLIFTRHAYLKNGWDRLDFLILLFSWVEESGIVDGGVSKAARIARAFSPLRAMKRNEGMKKVIDALLRTLHPVAYVVAFTLITFMVFAVIGMGFFGGLFFRCSAPDVAFPFGKMECAGAHVDAEAGVLVPRAWTRPPQHFDSLYDATLTLFQVSTVKYVKVLEAAMDVTTLGVSPKLDYSSGYAGYFVVYLLVGSLFVMNLFVGFIVDGFNVNHGRTKADQLYNTFLRNLKSVEPSPRIAKPPKFIIAEYARRLEASWRFQLFSAACVLINTGFMLTDHAEHTGGPDNHEVFMLVMFVQNAIFYAELCFEICLYLLGNGPVCFVRDAWKAFDLAVALGLSFGYIFQQAELGQFTKALRMLRIARLVRMIKPVKIVLETFVSSLPQLANVLFLLFLVYSIFAAVAMRLFGTVKYGVRVGPTANFEDFGNSMIAIYQVVTGDEWMDMMADCSVQPPECTEQFEGFSFGDCGSVYAPAYFLTLKLVCESVMLNLFIGMILDNFSFFNEDAVLVEDAKWFDGPSAAQVDELAVVFCKFDAGTAKLPLASVHGLLCTLPQPLGFRGAQGELQYGKHEKQQEKVIRAELNLIVLRNKAKKAPQGGLEILAQWARKAASKGWRRLTGRREFSSAVGFTEVMLTLLYWRKPSMVPTTIQGARGPLMADVLRMAHRLTILDFFQLLVVSRRKQRIRKQNEGELKFQTWARSDPHALRRNRLRAKLHAAAVDVRRGKVSLPAATTRVKLLELLRTPQRMVTHEQALRNAWPDEDAKVAHGEVLFREMAGRARVVLRFLYPEVERRDVIADLREVRWQSWAGRGLRRDRFWEAQQGREWERVDVWLQPLRGAEEEGEVWGGGSLLDVQSAVEEVEEGGSDGGAEEERRLRSVVRLNIGEHAGKAQHKEGEEGQEGAAWQLEQCHSVLEVVGYYTEQERDRRLSTQSLSDEPPTPRRASQPTLRPEHRSPRHRSQLVTFQTPEDALSAAAEGPVAQVHVSPVPLLV